MRLASQRSNRLGDWKHVTLPQISIKMADGPFGSNLKSSHYVGKGVRVIRLQNVGVGKMLDDDLAYISREHFESLPRNHCKPGDLIVATLGDPNIRACIVPDDLPESLNKADCILLRPDLSQVDPNYLCALLNSETVLHQASALVRGQTRGRISLGRLKKLTLPSPPLLEQKRIAAILDAADALRAKRRESLEQLDALVQSTFLDMFGDPVENPMGWGIKELAEVVAKDTVVTYGIVQAGPEYPGGVPYIRTGDLVDGVIRKEALRHTSPLIAGKFDRSRVRVGEIVISIRATVGTTALVPEALDGANLTQGTARVSPGAGIAANFLLHQLRSLGSQRWLDRQVKGATFREITLGRLRQMPVIVPSFVLQQRFASIVDVIDRQKARLRAHLSELDDLFAALQQRAFAGEL